jgi:hypothetical protein
MTLVNKKDPLSGKRIPYWQKSFFIRQDYKKLKYRFIMCDIESGESIWEREPDRVCNFLTLSTVSPYKEYDTNPNKKDCIKFVRKHNKFIKYDVNFVADFHYNQVIDSIIIGSISITKYKKVGPYPQSESEIEQLSKQNVRGVLNLQTKTDMKYRSVDWHEQKELYKKHNIKARNFPIIDMHPDDMAFKAYDAATYLYELIKEYKVSCLVLLLRIRKYMFIVQRVSEGPLTLLLLI